jgi:hypothetical protein
MRTAKIRYPIRTLLAAAVLSLGLGLAPAAAGATAADGAGARSADREAAFFRAVLTCEERTARGTLADLRTCVHDLVAPDPGDAQIFDLWRIFMDCLSLMSEAGPDAMYPTSHYEDKVNDCLGL